MKPCPHKHVEARLWSRHFQDWIALGPDHRTQPDALICLDCREWLGLGESKDIGPRVAIEIRAVEVLADHLSYLERDEVQFWPWSDCPWPDKDGYQCRACEAEDLARIIAEHPEPQ